MSFFLAQVPQRLQLIHLSLRSLMSARLSMTVGCLRLFFQTHRTCIRSHSPRIRTSPAILGLNIYQQRARSYMLANMLVLFLRKDLLVLERLRCWLFQPIHFPRRRNSEAPNDVSHVPTLFTCEVSTPRHVCLA